jgi:DNA polymerase
MLSKAELMEKIANEVRVCVKCPLSKGRRNAVPGEGNINAIIMFVGEAPGYWEDVKGLPFVGPAGKVLNGLMTKIGLQRESVFITNVVKCRPPENRDPMPLEIKMCTSLYLNQQIELIQPKVIVTLGKHSTSYIFSKTGLETVESITKLRGRVYQTTFQNIPVLVVPMYHPAAVLHNPMYQDKLERDFQLLRDELKKREYI